MSYDRPVVTMARNELQVCAVCNLSTRNYANTHYTRQAQSQAQWQVWQLQNMKAIGKGRP